MPTAAAIAAPTAAVPEAPAAGGRIRYRLTLHARMVGLVLLLMVVAAINYQSNAAWALVMALCSAIALSALHARRNLIGVRAIAAISAPVFAGEAPRATVTLSCLQPVEAVDVRVAMPSLDAAARAGAVPGMGSATVVVELPLRARGAWRTPSLRLSTRYPLGLIEAWREVPLPVEGLVYPAPAGDGAPRPDSGAEGVGAAGSLQGTEDFLGHRRYVAGDPQRLVDWKAHARGGPLLVKRFAGTGGGALWCDWALAQGDVEARLSQLARWVVESHRAGLRYGLRMPGSVLAPERGPGHYHACLRALALHEAPALAPVPERTP